MSNGMDDAYDDGRGDARRFRRRREDLSPPPPDPWLSGVPPWVRAIAVVGIPGTIAIFLVYLLATQLPKIEERQAAIEKQLDLERQTLDKEIARTDQVYRQLQRICSNTAKTDEDRQRCFDQ